MSDEPGREEAERKARADIDEGKQQAREAAEQGKAEGRRRLETGKDRAADEADEIAAAVESAASRLSRAEHESLADYAHQLSSYLGEMSGRLHSRNIDELAADVQRIARRNPALFVLGSVAVGVALSRFARASASERPAADGRSAERRDYRHVTAEARGERGAADRTMTPDATGGGGL